MSLSVDSQLKFQEIIDKKYQDIPLEKRKELYSLFKNQNLQKEIKDKLEKVLFKISPPSPEEFLDPTNKWLSKKVVDSIFPSVRQQFLNILNGETNYYKIAMYGCTRRGKSFLARLLIIYTIVFYHCLREPALYYGLSPSTELAIYLISFKFTKTKQVYLNYIYKMLNQSERFIRVDMIDQVYSKQTKIGWDKIVWCKAATTGEITLASGLQIQLGNNEALSSLGADALQAYISEVAYFIEYGGATEEDIFRLYTDISERIEATVGSGFLAYTYLDTSANFADSLIEKHIIEQLQFEDKVYFSWMSRWEVKPDSCPIWQQNNQTFKVITGSSDIPAKIIPFKVLTGTLDQPITIELNEKELHNIPKDLIIDVPIDFYKRFRDNLLRSIKDIAGRPTSDENKFINETIFINNMFNNPHLQNIEGLIKADASEMPENLLWNKLKDIFFSQSLNNKYIIKRAPKERRYIGIDNAYSLMGDLMGFASIHKEWSINKKQVIYIIDWCFPIGPKDKGINLDAPAYFVVDSIKQASINIKGMYGDTFESTSQKQFLERCNVKFFQQSVDSDLNPYQFFLTCLTNEIIKSGKNIFLKNNLGCLVKVRQQNGKEKIDHPKGITNNKYFGDWEQSSCGINAKDVSDAVCQALWAAYNDNEYIPTTIYEEENKKFDNSKENSQQLINLAFNKLHKIS